MTGNPTVRPQLWWITGNKGMKCKPIEDFLVLYHNTIFWGSFSTGTLWFNKLLNWLNWWESFYLVLPNETANKRVERTRGSGTTSPTHYFQQPQDAHFPSVTLFFQSLVHFDPVRSCATQVCVQDVTLSGRVVETHLPPTDAVLRLSIKILFYTRRVRICCLTCLAEWGTSCFIWWFYDTTRDTQTRGVVSDNQSAGETTGSKMGFEPIWFNIPQSPFNRWEPLYQI